MPRPRPLDPAVFATAVARGDLDLAAHQLDLRRDDRRELLNALHAEFERHRGVIEEVRRAQEDLRRRLEDLEGEPWHPAVVLRRLPGDGPPRAHVVHAGQGRVVGYARGVEPSAVDTGDEVFLSKELHLIMARSPHGLPAAGETAWFDRYAGDDRAVLRWRDEEIVVDLAAHLRQTELARGDQVRWSRAAWMAFERIQRRDDGDCFVDELEDIDADRVGGQQAALDTILAALTATLVDPQRAERYGLRGRRSILMEGPPGCGKTLMAKAAAARVRRMSGRRCRFAVVKPGEWLSPWVGETEQNIRKTFRALAAAAEGDGFAVLFLDEVEAIGRIRGQSHAHHADAALACLLAELNGFADRGNVALIAATNRKDLVDPALLERLSDIDIRVPRPDMTGCRAIFAIHLAEDLPYAEARATLVEAATARLFAPNGDNDICTVRFRDNRSRTVHAAELVSGRLIAQICDGARRRAFDRDLRSGEDGLRAVDLIDSVADACERLATTLTRHNLHAYLADLPQDVEVLAVEPVSRRAARPHRVLRAA